MLSLANRVGPTVPIQADGRGHRIKVQKSHPRTNPPASAYLTLAEDGKLVRVDLRGLRTTAVLSDTPRGEPFHRDLVPAEMSWRDCAT